MQLTLPFVLSPFVLHIPLRMVKNVFVRNAANPESSIPQTRQISFLARISIMG